MKVLLALLLLSTCAGAAPKLKTARIKIAQLTPQALAKNQDADVLLITAHCGESGPGQKDIPEALGQNTKLSQLLVGQPGRQDCELATTLPASLGQLKSLRVLSVDDSVRPKGEFPPVIARLEKLVELRFSRQALTEVPAEIRKLKNLKSLDLSSNELKEIPEWLGELKSLETLVLDYNHVKKLPGSLSHVKRVKLGNNSLKLAEQGLIKKEVPGADFENSFDDGFANEWK